MSREFSLFSFLIGENALEFIVQESSETARQIPYKALQNKDKLLIRQFSHTLRSSLVAIQVAIRNVMDTGSTDRLESVQFDIERVDRNLTHFGAGRISYGFCCFLPSKPGSLRLLNNSEWLRPR